jgi:glycerol-3-phosphate dehydrogenase
LGVTVYDLMGKKWQHGFLSPKKVKRLLPAIGSVNINGGVNYYDAGVDDSQLVLRVIMDGVRFGGCALNYARVVKLCRSKRGRVEGVVVQDESNPNTAKSQVVVGNVIINATGPWSDELRATINGRPKLRRLRGSHLIFSQEKLPIKMAVTMLHPRDNRALFAIPWEGRTMIGTTDLDHTAYEDETRITSEEVTYLLEATQHAFPDAKVGEEDIISTFSGLRPVINTGAPTPSKESRAHKIWQEEGLVTVGGGKLTIFRIMAADVLNFCREDLPGEPHFEAHAPCFIHPQAEESQASSNPNWQMMAGRLGQGVNTFFKEAIEENLEPIQPIPQLWAELPWAAKNEAVIHLDDLLLRRVRMGLLMPEGGMGYIEKIRKLVQSPLGWDDTRWQTEVQRYQDIWQKYYYLPTGQT